MYSYCEEESRDLSLCHKTTEIKASFSINKDINFSLKNMRYLEIFKIKSDLENYLNDSAFNFIPQTYLENISQTLRKNFY